MKHIIFEEANTYSIALLVKSSAFKQQELLSNYIQPLNNLNVASKEIIGFTLKYNEVGKAPAKYIKEYLDNLLPALHSLGVTYLYVTDASYFKVLTKQVKAEPHYGYVLPCAIKGYEHMNVVLGLNYQALIYNPELQAKLDMSLTTLASHIDGSHQVLGSNIIHSAYYPEGTEAIAKALDSLHQYKHLSCDIETFSLRFNEAGIGSIAFAWDQHNGIAFACDYSTEVLPNDASVSFGSNKINLQVRYLLRQFFMEYKGEITAHNAAYDFKILIYVLWMESLLDTKGLLTGLQIMTRSFQDTKIIAYLATNTTAGNVLGLKALAHEFAGNWAVEEIKDIRKIPVKDLLQYNLVDCLSTNYVKDKYYPIMVQDQQEAIYKELMLPSLKVIIQMELTGMPMDATVIQSTREELEAKQLEQFNIITNSPVIKVMDLLVQTSAMEKANAKLKTKQHPLEKFSGVSFNPNSGPQLQRLLYEQMRLPVLDYTDTKQPATGADTIEKLIHHTQNTEYKALLDALIQYGKVDKILTTFIPAFEQGIDKADGRKYLHGSFNLGGTVSGRLSSSRPNMTNLPAGSTYGKMIKKCFKASPGWIFAGADFASLEDYVSALTTRDRNKLRVYEEGYCGHCLRAFKYFGSQMPDIVDTVDSINSIKKKYPQFRQDSKPATFLLTYGGTYHGLISNLGWDETKAKDIEKGYHELYRESDEFIQKRLAQASKDGYVDVAFGLRVRTPLLSQVMFGKPRMPFEAAAEGRTAGNAMGQSYCMLNSRAMNAFMEIVWASKYRYDILPVAQIHDAGYYLIRDDAEIVTFANKSITEAMAWQELPELQHDTVKLSAQLDLYWPDWSNASTLPSNANQDEIRKICTKAKEDYATKNGIPIP